MRHNGNYLSNALSYRRIVSPLQNWARIPLKRQFYAPLCFLFLRKWLALSPSLPTLPLRLLRAAPWSHPLLFVSMARMAPQGLKLLPRHLKGC